MKAARTSLAIAAGIVAAGLVPWHGAQAQQSLTVDEIRDVLGLFEPPAPADAPPAPQAQPQPPEAVAASPDQESAAEASAPQASSSPEDDTTAARPPEVAVAPPIPTVADDPRGTFMPRPIPSDEGHRVPPAVAIENRIHVPRGEREAGAPKALPPQADPPPAVAADPPPAAEAPRRGLLGRIADWLRGTPAPGSGMTTAFREAGNLDWETTPPSRHTDRVLADLQRVREGADAPAAAPAPAPAAVPAPAAASVRAPAPARAAATSTPAERVLEDLRTVRARSAAPTRDTAPALALATATVDPSQLDRVRGGFDTGNGLQVSFGIDRAVYVNGSLVTTTSFNVVQVGAGNAATSNALSQAALAQVVQNSLDGQKIQSMTVINATANSLSVLRSMNLQSSLRSAVIDSLRR